MTTDRGPSKAEEANANLDEEQEIRLATSLKTPGTYVPMTTANSRQREATPK